MKVLSPYKLTVQIATDLFENHRSNEQKRRFDAKHAEMLAGAIRRGEWRIGNDAIVVNEAGFLDNGQHRCSAVIRSGTAIDVILIENAAPENFYLYDAKRKTRGVAQQLLLAGHKNSRQLNSCLRYLWSWLHGRLFIGDLTFSPNYEQANKILEKLPSLNEAISSCRVKKLEDILLSYGGFYKLLMDFHNNQLSDIFFGKVSGAIPSCNTEPEFWLRSRLLASGGGKTVLRDREKAALIITAWNFRSSSRSCKSLKWDSKKSPFPTFNTVDRSVFIDTFNLSGIIDHGKIIGT